MKSHSLASKFKPVPESLRATLVGLEVDVPEFGDADPKLLEHYRVALIVSHGPELPEFSVPLQFLRDRGAKVDVVTQNWLFDHQPAAPGTIVLAQFLATNVCTVADMPIRDAKTQDYDAILTVGGAWNPILLRTDVDVLDFIRSAQANGQLIASICHGPQLLISTMAFSRGTRVTGVDDIVIDLSNAGFEVAKDDNDVIFDAANRLLTARNPGTLKLFCEQLAARLIERTPKRT